MDHETKRLQEQILRTSGVNPLKCMRCGKCSGTCPSYDEMEYHPHQFVYMVETGDIEPLMQSKSLYKCLTCFACVDRCPRGVEPAKLVEALRLCVIRQKGKNHMTADDILVLSHDSTLDRVSDAAAVFGAENVLVRDKTLAELKQLNMAAQFVSRRRMPISTATPCRTSCGSCLSTRCWTI